MAIARNVLQQLGIPEERLWLRFISASQGAYFGEVITEMTQKLKQIGPNPLRKNWEI